MKKLIVIGMILCLSSVTYAIQTIDYGWEDSGTILSSYGNLVNPANVTMGSDPGTNNENPSYIPALTVLPRTGGAMLEVIEDPHSGTPQAFVAFIENLSEGDQVTASFYGWDSTEGASPSMRIWGHYALNGNVDSYEGSAGGNDTYTTGLLNGQWSQVDYTWTVEAGKEALVIELRLYSTPSTGPNSTNYWIDDLHIDAPDAATVNIPGPVQPTNTPGGPTYTPVPTDTPLPPTSTPTATPTGPTPTPPPVDAIKINEAYFNSPGTDAGCFVELYFPGGDIALDGYTLVGINGNGGTEYNAIDLTGYVIPVDGYFVIAQDGTVVNGDLIDSGVNYQNGPDSIQIKMGTTVVDAIGYGDFTSAVFAGEGTPVPAFFADGASHSRIPDGMDTDNNVVDFMCGILTPGEMNAACPDPTVTPTPEPATPTPEPTSTPTSEPPTATPTATPTGSTCIHHGDCNLDGEVTAGDAQYCFGIALGMESPTAEEYCAADCNGDSEVTAGDAQGIFSMALGIGTCLDPL